MSENAFDGLGNMLTSTLLSSTPQEPLTVEHLEKLVNTLHSDEYIQREREREAMTQRGHVLISKALMQGIITEAEFWHLCESIGINGYLIVSPSMSDRLAKVVYEVQA